MKKLLIILIALFSLYCFAVNKQVRDGFIEEFNNIEKKLNEPKQNEYSQETIEYFNEIAGQSEYGSKNNSITKWNEDVKIFVSGDKKPYMMDELNKIVTELNDLINPINIQIVNNESESNLKVFLGSHTEFSKICPKSKKYLNDNWGLFFTYGNEYITSADVFVDTKRCDTRSGCKHLLREELTQSLGLTNDSYRFPESIFYQNWTETNEYAQVDRDLIQILYNN